MVTKVWFCLLVNVLLCVPSIIGDYCPDKAADIAFLLDGSDLTADDSRTLRDFVYNFVNGYTIGPDHVRIGVISFSSHIDIQFNLKDFNNKQDLLEAISNIQFTPGNTYTHKGLAFARRSVFKTVRGGRDEVPDILIVITNGRPNKPGLTTATQRQADNLHKAGVTTFALGVGANVDQTELSAIASQSGHEFHVDSYSQLSSHIESLRLKLHPVDGNWASWSEWGSCTDGNCGNGTRSRSRNCTNPTPECGGQGCVGLDRESQPCNDYRQGCEMGAVTFDDSLFCTAGYTEMPCPAGTVFSLDNCSCDHGNSANMIQLSTECLFKEGCPLGAVNSNSTLFCLAGTIKSCPPSTEFSLDICTCVLM